MAKRITVQDGECLSYKEHDDYFRRLMSENKEIDISRCRK